jgi:hypothetical protein
VTSWCVRMSIGKIGKISIISGLVGIWVLYWPYRLAARTEASQASNRSSILRKVTASPQTVLE